MDKKTEFIEMIKELKGENFTTEQINQALDFAFNFSYGYCNRIFINGNGEEEIIVFPKAALSIIMEIALDYLDNFYLSTKVSAIKRGDTTINYYNNYLDSRFANYENLLMPYRLIC